MVSIIGLAHFLNAIVELGAGALFLTKPELGFPPAAGNPTILELVSILGYAVTALGVASLLSLLFGASIGSKKTLGLALLVYHVPVAVGLGLKVQADPKLLEQIAPVLGAHSLLSVLFLVGSLFSRDAGSAKKNKRA